MRATTPTTRATHACAHLIESDGYAPFSGLILLRSGNPTNPFIACERRYIVPQCLHILVRLDRPAEIRRQTMHRPLPFRLSHYTNTIS